MAKLKYSSMAYIHTYALRDDGTKDSFCTHHVPCRMDGKILFNGYWRKVGNDGKVEIKGVKFSVNGHHYIE